jgi:hypothetical protein
MMQGVRPRVAECKALFLLSAALPPNDTGILIRLRRVGQLYLVHRFLGREVQYY